jgi:hypothetical protein
MQETPFSSDYQLNNELDSPGPLTTPQELPLRLPGQPRICMTDTSKIQELLQKEFLLRDLEDISKHLWMMSKQDSKNISPLHRQKVKNREIIITEDPRLHLIWYHDRIFIKPLPKYLLSHKFWQSHLSFKSPLTAEQKSLRRAVLGYLRTYVYLVRYESDFRIALGEDLQLIPKDISFLKFSDFIAQLESITDREVSERYAYGEIRLTRLNLYSKIFLGKFNFHRVNAQYSDYFATFYGPILFIFAIFSVLLNSMQLEMAVQAVDTAGPWKGYWHVCRWFSIVCVGLVVCLVLWLVVLLLYKFVKEWVNALGDRWGLRKEKVDVEDES